MIGELSEYNAAKILKMAYDLLDIGSSTDGQIEIDEKFVTANKAVQEGSSDKGISTIEDVEPEDLLKKAGS
jgi:hypothetical protein